METIVVIPARYESSRYPGKPLVKLSDGQEIKEAILWTYDAAKSIPGVDKVYVATDDERIRSVVEEARNAAVIMTSRKCNNGTERVAEAVEQIGIKKDDVVVNFQGDAPLTPASFVTAVVEKLKQTPWADMTTPVLACDRESYLRFKTDREENRVGATTAVFNRDGNALYFSKEVIPFLKTADELLKTSVYHHVGVYAYRPVALLDYRKLPMGPLERGEGLEQLRFLENNKKIGVVEVDAKGREFWELNNREDVAIIERMMRKNALLPQQNS